MNDTVVIYDRIRENLQNLIELILTKFLIFQLMRHYQEL